MKNQTSAFENYFFKAKELFFKNFDRYENEIEEKIDLNPAMAFLTNSILCPMVPYAMVFIETIPQRRSLRS